MAASSQLAKQYYRLAKKNDHEVINIVRKDEQVAALKEELGAKYVLNQLSPTFAEDLKATIAEVQPTIMFEYVGGSIPGQVFAAMPNNSQMVVVGNLTGETLNIISGDLLFRNKSIVGFILFGYLLSIPKETRDAHFAEVSNDLRDGGKIFGSNVYKEFPLAQYEEAVSVSAANATEGKVLINCQ